MSNHSLVLNGILDWDDFLVNQRGAQISSLYSDFIRNRLTNVLKNVDKTIDSVEIQIQERSTSNLYYETESIIRFKAKILFRSLLLNDNVTRFRVFLKRLVSRTELHGVYFSLDSSCEGILYPNRLLQGTVFQSKDIKSFKLGTIVGVGNFVSFFDSEQIHSTQLQFHGLETQFKHDLKSLHVFFYDPYPKKQSTHDGQGIIAGHRQRDTNQYELKVKYESIHSLVLLPSDNFLEVFLVLKCPPSLYMKLFSADKNKGMGSSREKTFCMRSIPGGPRKIFLASDFGRCNVLSLKMSMTGLNPWIIVSTLKRFMDYSTPIPFYLGNISFNNQSKTLRDYYSRDSSLAEYTEEVVLPDFMRTNEGHHYAFNCCLSLNHYVFSDLTLSRRETDGTEDIDWHLFWVIVEDKFDEDPVSVMETFYDIFRSLERNSFIRVLRDFPVIYRSKRHNSLKFPRVIEYPGICRIRRAVLTPTRMILMPPHPVVQSRLLTECDPNFALRVQIREDWGPKLSFTLGQGSSDEKQLSFLNSCVTRLIVNGIQVGPNRRYEFLGTTSSQLREHGIILYAQDLQGRRAKDLREKMGDFRKIRCVGKHIARVGQTLSQKLSSIIITPGFVLVSTMDDVKGGLHPYSGKPYVFTDGIGQVSLSLARKMAESLPKFYLHPGNEIPSAFQIRYQGFKGMVVVNPFLRDRDYLYLRRSMNKFVSDTDSLEILKISKPRAVYLNRPLICLLDQLGTDFKILDKLLSDSLKPLAKSLYDESAANKSLSEFCPFLYSLLDLKAATEAGISILSDQFLRPNLQLVLRKKLQQLKEKERIRIPFNSGRIMFGVVDEYGILQYGEVFVQYSKDIHTPGTAFLEGQVMVTRFPCMHPGDIRMLKAVDNPVVRQYFGHIKDCIVFPQKGHRPHPNEMGGGDLDGDEYAVIWMKDLFIQQKFYPMTFSDEPAVELDEDVQDHHQLDFICEFIQTNSVGVIANAWLATADHSLQGVCDPKCLELCQKYSTALDFAKTGRNDRLPLDQRPKHAPDFFENGSEKSTYKSRRALGALFDKVCLVQLALDDSLYGDKDTSRHWKFNSDFVHPNWEKYKNVALNDYSYYESRMVCLMKELSIDSEVSLLSTVLDKKTGFFTGKNDVTDLQELLERLVRIEFESFRKRFEDFGREVGVTDDDRLKKASAYYHISYDMALRSTPVGMDVQKKLLGFHWIAFKELAKLAQMKEINRLLAAAAVSSKQGNKDRVANLIDQYVCYKVVSGSWSHDTYDQDPRDTAIEKILRLWIIKHPLHSLIKSSDEALVNLMKDFVDEACSSILLDQQEVSIGSIIVHSLQKLIDSWISMPAVKGENTSLSGPLRDLGLAAITTYIGIMQTTMIYPLVDDSASLGLPGDEYYMRQYRISLDSSSMFAEKVACFHHQVLRYMHMKSGVKDIAGYTHFQGNYKYWMVTAIGNRWQLDALNNIVIWKDFNEKAVEAVNKMIEGNEYDLN